MIGAFARLMAWLNNHLTTKQAFLLITPVMLFLIALLEMPYAYYGIMKVYIFGCVIYLWLNYKHDNKWKAALVFLAVLYNPVFTIHLTKSIWAGVNLITAIFFFLHHKKFERKE
jgi:hypothetical protein